MYLRILIDILNVWEMNILTTHILVHDVYTTTNHDRDIGINLSVYGLMFMLQVLHVVLLDV